MKQNQMFRNSLNVIMNWNTFHNQKKNLKTWEVPVFQSHMERSSVLKINQFWFACFKLT